MRTDDSPDYCRIGRRVRYFRKQLGLTQEQLAEAADLSPPYLSHIEQGSKKASLRMLLRLAAALDVTIDMLLTERKCPSWTFNPSCPLSQCSACYAGELQKLLEDCSNDEQRFLLKLAEAAKQIMRDTA